MAMDLISPHLRTELLGDLTRALYAKSRLAQHRELVDIIAVNSRHNGNTQFCMSFRSKIYECHTHNIYPTPMNLLKPAVRDRMKAYCQAATDLQTDEDLVMGYIKAVMARTGRIADYYRLIPESLHRILRAKDKYFVQGTGRFNEEDATEFLDEHAKYIGLIRSRMLYNLLEP